MVEKKFVSSFLLFYFIYFMKNGCFFSQTVLEGEND